MSFEGLGDPKQLDKGRIGSPAESWHVESEKAVLKSRTGIARKKVRCDKLAGGSVIITEWRVA